MEIKTVFTKESILNSKKYSDKHDVLDALLSDNKTYTIDEIDKLIEKFLKGKVKN